MLMFGAGLAATGIMENIDPYFYKLFVDLIPKGNQREIAVVLVLFGINRMATLIIENLMRAAGDAALLPAARDARVAVVQKMHDLDFAFHTSKSTGSLISLIKRGDGAFFDFFHSININSVRVVFGFGIMIFFLIRIRWEIALLSAISFGMAGIATRFLIRNNIRARKEFNVAEDQISDIIVDNLINFETVKLFAREKWERKRLENGFTDWIKKLWGYSVSFRAIDMWVGGLGNAGFVAVLVMGLDLVKKGEMTVGDYVMVLGFITNFFNQFFQLVYNLRNIAKNSVDIQKYFGILNEEVKVKDPIKPIKIKGVAGEVKFSRVTFAYLANKKKAVYDIDLTIRPGQSVALVGHSGVGKTTLVKLLMRFFDPNKGKITIDGIDIREMTKEDLRSHMGVVPQEPVMFNNTIAYNIAYGQDKPSKREITAAAKMANLHDFIMTLPEKYETNVGERGVRLSGGQKQRLAIARMILKNPDIIIFDEATSQLDSESEKMIQDAFWKVASNKTTIIIAHRLSTVIRAEKIVVMEKGRIKEIGSHRQLLADQNSLYNRFWRLQSES